MESPGLQILDLKMVKVYPQMFFFLGRSMNKVGGRNTYCFFCLSDPRHELHPKKHSHAEFAWTLTVYVLWLFDIVNWLKKGPFMDDDLCRCLEMASEVENLVFPNIVVKLTVNHRRLAMGEPWLLCLPGTTHERFIFAERIRFKALC